MGKKAKTTKHPSTKDVRKLQGVKELYALLENKTILGMYKWVKEHSDYLIWFCNYNKAAITKVMNLYGEMTNLFNKIGNEEAKKDFLDLSVLTVVELELNCK